MEQAFSISTKNESVSTKNASIISSFSRTFGGFDLAWQASNSSIISLECSILPEIELNPEDFIFSSNKLNFADFDSNSLFVYFKRS